jgi:hypothetical protein
MTKLRFKRGTNLKLSNNTTKFFSGSKSYQGYIVNENGNYVDIEIDNAIAYNVLRNSFDEITS